MISNMTAPELQSPELVLSEENTLLGPWIVGDIFWRNGTYYTVGFRALNASEQKLDIGFLDELYHPVRQVLYDRRGRRFLHEPQYLGWCAYTTIYGMEQDICTQRILGRIRAAE